MDKHTPWKIAKVKGKHLPWISPELISLFRQRHKAWSTFRQTRDNTDWEVYRQLRNMSKAKTHNAKSNYYKDCLTRDFKNPKQFWSKLKTIINTSDKHSINQAQAFNQHFSSVSSTLLPNSYLTTGVFSNNSSCCSSFSFRKILPTEAQNAISELNVNSMKNKKIQ